MRSFLRTTGWGPFPIPGESRRKAEAIDEARRQILASAGSLTASSLPPGGRLRREDAALDLARLKVRPPCSLPLTRTPERRVAVYGFIVWDLFATLPGQFHDSKRFPWADPVASESIEEIGVNYSLMSVDFGGIAANIAYGLGRIGVRPVLLGYAGQDFTPTYHNWLSANGVDTRGVRMIPGDRTSLFLLLEDSDHQRITRFYPISVRDSLELRVHESLTGFGSDDLVLITPGPPWVMKDVAAYCRASGISFALDPSERMHWLSDADLRELASGARYLIGDVSEIDTLQRRTGWKDGEVFRHVTTLVVTRGVDGVDIFEDDGRVPIRVASVRSYGHNTLGVGDAFRAGFFGGIAYGLNLERSAQLGSVLASLKLEAGGTQGSDYHLNDVLERLNEGYGQAAADDIRNRLLSPEA